MKRPSTKQILRRRGRSLVDRDHDEIDTAEYQRAEAEFEAFLNRKPTCVEPLDRDPADDSYDPRDRADNEDLIVWERGRTP